MMSYCIIPVNFWYNGPQWKVSRPAYDNAILRYVQILIDLSIALCELYYTNIVQCEYSSEFKYFWIHFEYYKSLCNQTKLN